MADRLQILILEDEQDLAGLLVELLSDLGFQVRACSRLEEAEQLAESGLTAHAILADLTLPDASPGEVVPRLRASIPGSRIIAMSAMAPRALERLAASSGADGAISKPFDIEELERLLRHLCA